MLSCNHPNCKKHKTCNLNKPITPLTQVIQYWLNELQKEKRKIKEYREVLKDIQVYHKYSIPVNVYGHIEYAPKVNAFGVHIRRPEHVNYGWNWNKLNKNVNDLTEKVRNLRLMELEMMR